MANWPTGSIPTDQLDSDKDSPLLARPALLSTVRKVNDMVSLRGQADGFPPLDANAKIPFRFFPASALGGYTLFSTAGNQSYTIPTDPVLLVITLIGGGGGGGGGGYAGGDPGEDGSGGAGGTSGCLLFRQPLQVVTQLPSPPPATVATWVQGSGQVVGWLATSTNGGLEGQLLAGAQVVLTVGAGGGSGGNGGTSSFGPLLTAPGGAAGRYGNGAGSSSNNDPAPPVGGVGITPPNGLLAEGSSGSVSNGYSWPNGGRGGGSATFPSLNLLRYGTVPARGGDGGVQVRPGNSTGLMIGQPGAFGGGGGGGGGAVAQYTHIWGERSGAPGGRGGDGFILIEW